MCDPPRVHVFLGAPPASSGPDQDPEGGEEAALRPPWTHLELTWSGRSLMQKGRSFQPAADFVGGSSSRGPGGAEQQNPDNPAEPGVDRTPRPGPGPDGPAERVTTEEPETREEEGEECRSLIQEYLERCFPSALPEPEPEPGPGPGPGSRTDLELELLPDSEPGQRPLGGPESAAGPDPGPDPQLEAERKSDPEPGPEPESISIQCQFLATWTLSQALILRGRNAVQPASSPEKTPPTHPHTPPSASSGTPDLFGPESTSLGASAELFSHSCSTPRAEEGGVILHATADGVLCSQESPRRPPAESPRRSPTRSSQSPTRSSQSPTRSSQSPTRSPLRKKARVSLESRSEAPLSSAPSAGLQRATTLLARCDRPGSRFSVLVAVVHPCHLKEVRVKSGRSAGTVVPLATIVVTDQSDVDRKLVLWRRAAFWVVTVSPGDVLLVTGLQVNQDRWRGESFLQSTFSTKLLNLGPVTGSAPLPVSLQVNAHSLAALCMFLRGRRPLLTALEPRPPQDLTRLPYAPLRSLRVNTLVNAILRVTHTHLSSAWRGEAESLSRSALQVKAVVGVEAADGQQGALLLWGSAVDWLPRFKPDSESLWDFRVLLVRDGLTSDLPELHSTPWSSVRLLDSEDRRALDFRATQRRLLQEGAGPLELDLETLLSQKYSGDVELRVQIVSFYFLEPTNSQNAPGPVLDGSSPLDAILAALSGDVTYAGCSRCSAELRTDNNNIYRPCYSCLPHTGLGRFYRPGVLSVSGRSLSGLSLHVPPGPLQKILEAPPDHLQRSSGRDSGVKWLRVAAERLAALLAPRSISTVTLRSRFLLDENGAVIHQDFTLLHLLPDGPTHT